MNLASSSSSVIKMMDSYWGDFASIYGKQLCIDLRILAETSMSH